MPVVPINLNVIATTTVVNASTPAGQQPRAIRVEALFLLSGGINTITINDTVTGALTGPMPVVAQTPINPAPANKGDGILSTDPGSGLSITLAAAQQLSGWLTYEYM